MNRQSFDELLIAIGDRLIALRREKGYSSHENFAFDFDISRAQYWKLEKGKSNCTLKTLYRIIQIHGMELPQFFALLNAASRMPD